jgi:threonine dehydrogenase-like Zn-dependent dehydrogenase
MGHEAVGEVVEVGKGVGKFKVGDKVFSPFHLSCGESVSGLSRVDQVT